MASVDITLYTAATPNGAKIMSLATLEYALYLLNGKACLEKSVTRMEVKLNFSYHSMKSYLPLAPARSENALLKTHNNSTPTLLGQFESLTPS